MSRLDLLDGLISYYRTAPRSKKLFLRFFFHLIDMTVFNGCLIYLRDCKKSGIPKQGDMDLPAFKCKYAESLCNLEAEPLKSGRPSTDKVEQEIKKKKKRGKPKTFLFLMLGKTSLVTGQLSLKKDEDAGTFHAN